MHDSSSGSQEPLLMYNAIGNRSDDKSEFIVSAYNRVITTSKQINFSVLFSFIKMVISIILSLCLTTYWKTCSQGNETREFECNASGKFMTCHTNDECSVTNYSPDGTTCKDKCYFGGYKVVGKDEHGCYGYVDNSCLCNFWYATVLLVICLNVLHYIVQLFYWRLEGSFNPQQLYLEVAVNGAPWSTYSLLFHPRNCLLSTIETATVLTAWLPLVYGGDIDDSVECSGFITAFVTGQNYYLVVYGIGITLMELYKANFQGLRDFKPYNNFIVDKTLGLTYFLRFDITLRYLFIQITQSVVFATSILLFCVPFWHFSSGYQDLKVEFTTHLETVTHNARSHFKALAINMCVFVMLVILLIMCQSLLF
jgi:hypothetical protein